MAEKLLKVLNGLLNAAILLTILGAILYSVYSIWDNNSIYAAALQLSVRIREYRPDEEKPSFEDLRRINPDVCAWVTMDGTNIDGPIVQGQTNEEYLNKDVYGDYSLAGTLFLDIFGASLCYCPACRKKFEKDYGYPLPETADGLIAHQKDIKESLDKKAEDFYKEMRDRLKKIDPSLAITINFSRSKSVV